MLEFLFMFFVLLLTFDTFCNIVMYFKLKHLKLQFERFFVDTGFDIYDLINNINLKDI